MPITDYNHTGRPDALPTIKRSEKPDGDAMRIWRESFAHWLYDETQWPRAQRAFRMLLRAKDFKLRLEAWKLAATILGPSMAAPAKDGGSRVNIALVNKIARPSKQAPAIETTATAEGVDPDA